MAGRGVCPQPRSRVGKRNADNAVQHLKPQNNTPKIGRQLYTAHTAIQNKAFSKIANIHTRNMNFSTSLNQNLHLITKIFEKPVDLFWYLRKRFILKITSAKST